MKLKSKHRYIIIIAIALFFIVYGFLNVQFNFNVSQEVENNVTWILTIVAVGLLFTGGTDRRRKKLNSNDDNTDSMNNMDSVNSLDNSELIDSSDLANNQDNTNDYASTNNLDTADNTNSIEDTVNNVDSDR